MPAVKTKLPLITAKSTSSRARGKLAASISTILMFLVFSAMSCLDAFNGSMPSFNLIQPNSFNITKARAKFEGSLGAATLLPSFTSFKLLALPA